MIEVDAIEPALQPEAQHQPAAEAGNQNEEAEKKRTKVSNAVKRARTNAKLRRALNPKNSVTLLNELRPGNLKFKLIPTFVDGPPGRWAFKATTEIDGKPYSGLGTTLNEAKRLAAESALMAIVADQVKRAQLRSPATDAADADGSEEEDERGEGEGEPKKKKRKVEQDQFPWGGLAAFALHKLFAEWKIEADSRLPAARIPADANKKHPVMLLNELVPNLNYLESTQGNQVVGTVFRASVCVNGTTYAGSGKNKKEARKQAAKAALADFGVVYDANF